MIGPSVMVLVKNESYFLPYVLKQTEGHFDSYVIYDVGSTDNTRNIIDWWVNRMDGGPEIFVRYLPHVDPKVQGAFRNSMIVEGQREFYFILDGDELYTQEDMAKVPNAARSLHASREFGTSLRYGVFKRVEINEALTMQYDRRRSHHRLYHQSAFWTGTHPGEVAGYKQNEASEIWYDDITCWHFHNALRSPNEADALKRLERKVKKSYHPGELTELNLLDELPILRERIEDFPVTPALEALWG